MSGFSGADRVESSANCRNEICDVRSIAWKSFFVSSWRIKKLRRFNTILERLDVAARTLDDSFAAFECAVCRTAVH